MGGGGGGGWGPRAKNLPRDSRDVNPALQIAPSLCQSLRIGVVPFDWKLVPQVPQQTPLLLPTIRSRHFHIRYNTKFFKRRVTYGTGNLASYNTSVITLEFFTAWNVNLNPGPTTSSSHRSSNRRSSPTVNSRLVSRFQVL
jgi:hypothetical protein